MSDAQAIALASGQRFRFRLLQPGDAAALGAYFAALSAATRGFYAPHPFTAEQAGKLCAELATDNALRLVAVTADKPAAAIVAYIILGLVIGQGELTRYREHGVALEPSTACTLAPSVADAYQSCGLGTAVMPAVLARARDAGRRQMLLQGGVQAANARAVHFYRKLGFRPVGSFRTTVDNYDMILDF